jgi:biopolymer transport protein TolQ
MSQEVIENALSDPLTQQNLAQHSVLDMVLSSGPVVQGVLLLLIAVSFISWAIAIGKWIHIRKVKRESAEFGALFWEARNFARVDDTSHRLQSSPLARIFRRGYRELSQLLESNQQPGRLAGQPNNLTPTMALDMVERSLRRAQLEELHKLESGTTFLATTASGAPFVGLFGTVWGIMNAFHGLGLAKSSTLQAVAPGISEALVATAVGLAAAIPAAVAYNYFAVDVRRFREESDKFIEEFLTIARSYLHVIT